MEFYLLVRVNKAAKSLIKCQNKKMSTMRRKTQNGRFIISYSKFLDLKFMDQFQSLLGLFYEFLPLFDYFW